MTSETFSFRGRTNCKRPVTNEPRGEGSRNQEERIHPLISTMTSPVGDCLVETRCRRDDEAISALNDTSPPQPQPSTGPSSPQGVNFDH